MAKRLCTSSAIISTAFGSSCVILILIEYLQFLEVEGRPIDSSSTMRLIESYVWRGQHVELLTRSCNGVHLGADLRCRRARCILIIEHGGVTPFHTVHIDGDYRVNDR